MRPLSLKCSIALAVAFTSISATAASASTLGASGNQILYQAGTGEKNAMNVSITGAAGAFVVHFIDTGANIVPAGQCQPLDNPPAIHRVDCTIGPGGGMEIDLGDMDDALSVGTGFAAAGAPNSPFTTLLTGGDGVDVISGSDVTDEIHGDAGGDVISGNAGDDLLLGGADGDDISGGDGNDTASYDDHSAPVFVTLDNASNDGAGCQPGSTTPCEGDKVGSNLADIENVIGGDGNDTLIGNSATNSLDGGAGNDTLDGGLGTDDLTGGSGNDTASYAFTHDAAHGVTANTSSGGGNGNENDTYGSIENLTGSAGNDVLSGVAGTSPTATAPNILDGFSGNDKLIADNEPAPGPGNTPNPSAGGDTYIGGSGRDIVDYSARSAPLNITEDNAANDGQAGETDNVKSDIEQVDGGTGNDRITGSDANNTLNGNDGNDTLDGGLGADVLNGGNGSSDTATYGSRPAPVTITLDGVANDGQAGEGDNVQTENATGGAGDDTIVGDGNANSLNGGDGNDTLDGGLGGDALTGGAGTDTTTYASRSNPVTVTLGDGSANDGQAGENDQVDTENVIAGAGSDTLTGDANNNVIDGRGGVDKINGQGGNDTLLGGAGNDDLNGSAGDDTLDGGTGSDVLAGSAGTDDTATYAGRAAPVTMTIGDGANDGETGEADDIQSDVENLTGGDAGDTITGNGGSNVLDGGGGDDTLDGGPGTASDTFIGGPGTDTADYSARSDNLSLTLNGKADDGAANEKDNLDTTIESVIAGSGNDAINIRDGKTGAATCGGGIDSASADVEDTVAADCETVDRAVFVPPPPPGDTGGGTGGDTGGGGTANPPADNSTNPNTNQNQSQNNNQTQTKPKPKPVLPRSLSVRVTPRRDRSRPYRFVVTGAVGIPSGTSRSAGCGSGRVSVQVKVGTKTISTRRASIDFNCRYRVTLSFADLKRLGNGRLKLTVRWLGNATLLPRQARSIFVRAG